MNSISKEIKDYWYQQSPYFSWDSEVLNGVVDSLTETERDILKQGWEAVKSSGDAVLEETYLFTVHKAFNRHNDIICGYSYAEGGEVICTAKSSITELDISPTTLRECNKNAFYHVNDIEKKLLPTLSFEAIADVTAAILLYNEQHMLEA